MNTNEIINLILGIIGVAGTAFGIWAFFRTKEEREPVIYYGNSVDIKRFSGSERLKVFFDNKEVNQVTTTYFFFWNKGKRPIKSEDLPRKLMVVYPADDIKILDFELVKVSRELINFTVNRCGDSILEFSFDFLDKNDGAVLAITHSGTNYVLPSIVGTIIGVPKEIIPHYLEQNPFYREKNQVNLRSLSDWRRLLLFYRQTVFYVVGILLGLASGISISIEKKEFFEKEIFLRYSDFVNSNSQYILWSIIILFFIIIGFEYYKIYSKRKYPYPKSLDISEHW